MTYLMTSLEELFVIDIIAFADQSHSVVEARNLMLDLMLEAFAEDPVVINLAAAVAKPIAVAIVKVATESVTSIAAVAAVAVTVMAALVCVTYQMHPVVIVAAPEPWAVVICVLSADQFAYLSYQTEFQATVVAAAVTQKHYFEGPTVADAYQRGCFAEPLTVVVAAAACFEDYSAGQASSVAAAAACPQHCLVVQLIDSVAYLLHLTVAPSAAAAAVAAAVEVTLAAAAQMPVDE